MGGRPVKKRPPTGREVSTAWRVPWWRKCVACGLMFRRERAWKGWRWIGRPLTWRHQVGGWRAYVCRNCAPEVKDAEKHFGEQSPPPRPRASMLPPPPPYRPRKVALGESLEVARN